MLFIHISAQYKTGSLIFYYFIYFLGEEGTEDNF